MRGTPFLYTTLFFVLLLLHVAAGVYFNGYTGYWIIITILLYIGVVVLGCINIQWDFFLKSQHRLPIIKIQFDKGNFSVVTQNKTVALTFDDGPAETTIAILDILMRQQVKATFFVIGKNIEARTAVLNRMHKEGHVIGNHSFEHGFHFDWLSAKAMQSEMEQCNNAISTITQKPVTLFRPPYGVTNPNVAKAVHSMALNSIGWSLRSKDTVAKNPDALLKKILLQVQSRDIILLHDRCPITVTILEPLIIALKERHYQFVTID
jgi:peptidoglycan/xylan/chitin deacetylase (PgdA/CDA1 family)